MIFTSSVNRYLWEGLSVRAVPVLHRGHSRMFPEIPSEKGLVGKAHPMGNFLYAEVGGLQCGLHFRDGMAVNNAFGRDMFHLLCDGGKITRCDMESFSIEDHFAVRGTVVVYLLDKTLEQFLLTVYPSKGGRHEKALRLVIYIHHQALDAVTCNENPEMVVTVMVDVVYAECQCLELSGMFRRKERTRGLLKKMEKEGVQPTGDLMEKPVGESDEGQPEISAHGCDMQHTSRQQDHLDSGLQLILLQVDADVRMSGAAEEDGCILQTDIFALYSLKIITPADERVIVP